MAVGHGEPHLPPGGAGCCLCCGFALRHCWPERGAALSSLVRKGRMRSVCLEMVDTSFRAEGRGAGLILSTQKEEQEPNKVKTCLHPHRHLVDSPLTDASWGTVESDPLSEASGCWTHACVPAVAMPSTGASTQMLAWFSWTPGMTSLPLWHFFSFSAQVLCLHDVCLCTTGVPSASEATRGH